MRHTLERIAKRLKGPPRTDATFIFNFMFEIVLFYVVQSAVGVMYQDHFLGAEAPLRQHERTNDIIGHNSTGVANDVSIAMGKPEHLENVHTTVHTSDNRQVTLGGEG